MYVEVLVMCIGECLQVDVQSNVDVLCVVVEQQQVFNSVLVECQQQVLIVVSEYLDVCVQVLLQVLEQQYSVSQLLLQDYEVQCLQQWQVVQIVVVIVYVELQVSLDSCEQQCQVCWDVVSVELQQVYVVLQVQLQVGDEQCLQCWSDVLQYFFSDLVECLQVNGECLVVQQQQVCDMLVVIVQQIGENGCVQVSVMLVEVFVLLQIVVVVLKVVVDVINELCSMLFESLVCDNVMLEECGCLLVIVQILFDVINYVLYEQCIVVDVLVGGLVELLECVGNCFIDYIVVEIGKLDGIVVVFNGSVGEVSQLVVFFGEVVVQFGNVFIELFGCLEQIGGVLDVLLVCSDEQLVYYVVQVCEVVDFSLLLQKQVMEELQQLVVCRGKVGSV